MTTSPVAPADHVARILEAHPIGQIQRIARPTRAETRAATKKTRPKPRDVVGIKVGHVNEPRKRVRGLKACKRAAPV